MEYYGYSGRILYVDLTTSHTETKPLDLDEARKFIGGFGLNQKLVYETLKPNTDPLSPDNPIIIGAGPLIGTLTPSSGKVQLTTKSTAAADVAGTKYFVGTASGGSNDFGLMLKNAGYDHLVVTGQASKPVYLKIIDDDVEICPADDLWGKTDIYETTDELNRRYGRCGVWAIGKAGENVVQFAHGLVDKDHTLGRNGGATVAGAKRLKAIAVKGTKGVKIWEPRKLRHLVNETNPKAEAVRDYFWESVRYSWRLSKKWLEYYPPELVRDSLIRFGGCSGCSFPCKAQLEVRDGGLAGTPHRTSPGIMIGVYGRRLEITDYREMMALVHMFNSLGLDYVTVVAMLKFVTRLYERGVIGKEDADGLELKMGDFNAYVRLTEKMASREGKLGNAMADGWFALSKAVGVNAWEDPDGENIAKGVSTLFDARFTSLDPTRFVNAVNPKGGQHLHPLTYVPGRTIDEVRNWYSDQAIPQQTIERVFTAEDFNTGRATKLVEDQEAVLFALGTCMMPVLIGTLNIPELAEYYTTVTGIEMSPKELRKAGERMWNLQKLLSVREGFTREDDRLPALWEIMIDNPIRSESRGDIMLREYFGKPVTRDSLKQMFDDYYDEHGWDIKLGIPTRQKLEELGLGEFAEALPK